MGSVWLGLGTHPRYPWAGAFIGIVIPFKTVKTIVPPSPTMIFLWLTIALVVGLVAGAFFILQSLIIICFGISFTLRLRRLGILCGRGPLLQYSVLLVLLPVLFYAVTRGMHAWLP